MYCIWCLEKASQILISKELLPIPTGRFAPVTSFTEKAKSSRLLVNRQKALNSSNVILCKKSLAIYLYVEWHWMTISGNFGVCFNLASWDFLSHVLPVGFIVFFIGIVKKPLCKVFSAHGVHTFGELQELHLLYFSLQVLHEPEEHHLLESAVLVSSVQKMPSSK